MNKFLLFKYLFTKAEVCYYRKEFIIALQYLNEVILLCFALPNNFISNAYELRGIVKINLNQHMEGIIDFNKAIHLYPKNSSLYFYRCLCYAVLSKYDDAIKDCKKLIELEPHESIHHHNLKFFENINK